MSEQGKSYTAYLNEHGILTRLHEILKHLVKIEPLPADPLMEILHALGCPLIPQAQMKTLERKVTRAQEELRYLRRMLIEMGGEKDLYDSDTDENEYVGLVGEMGAAPLYSSHRSLLTSSPPPIDIEHNLQALTGMQNEEEEPQSYQEEQPSCSHSVQQS